VPSVIPEPHDLRIREEDEKCTQAILHSEMAARAWLASARLRVKKFFASRSPDESRWTQTTDCRRYPVTSRRSKGASHA